VGIDERGDGGLQGGDAVMNAALDWRSLRRAKKRST